MSQLRDTLLYRYTQAKQKLDAGASSSFLELKEKHNPVYQILSLARKISYRAQMVAYKSLEILVSVPFFFLPKRVGFHRYARRDEEGRYMDSYVEYTKRRDVSIGTVAVAVMGLCVQILFSTKISFSQPRITSVLEVCEHECVFSSVQEAVENSFEGDVILVHPGTYRENIVLDGKKIVLKSKDGKEVTRLEGVGQKSVVTITGDAGAETVVDGFTITGGTGQMIDDALVGGGIVIDGAHTSPVIRNNEIRSNTADIGGGIFVRSGNPEISKNIFFMNKAEGVNGKGGALFVQDGKVTLKENTFQKNDASFFGGAVAIAGGAAEIDMRKNTFVENATRAVATEMAGGGAVSVVSGWASLRANRFENNTSAQHGGALFIQQSGKSVTIGDGALPNVNAFINNSAAANGGQIAVLDVGKADIQRNTFEETHAGSTAQEGGVIAFVSSQGLFSENRIKGGSAVRGGGLLIRESDVTLINDIFSGTTSEQGGATVHVEYKNTGMHNAVSMLHNVFSTQEVRVGQGAAVYVQGEGNDFTFINNVIERTVAGYGIFMDQHVVPDIFSGNDIWKNSAGDYNDTAFQKRGSGNISVNPQFVDAGNDDFHLQDTSLLIDRGIDRDPLPHDIDGEVRPFAQTLPDIGVDETAVVQETGAWYVDAEKGDDVLGTGHEQQPFKTLNHALELKRTGEGGIIFVQGAMSGSITLSAAKAGTEKQPLKISQWPGGKDASLDASHHEYGIALQHAEFVWINGLSLHGATKAAVFISDSHRTSVTNTAIFDNPAHGILIDSSNEVKIVNNTLVNNGVAAEFMHSSIAGTLKNNIFQIEGGQKGIVVSSDSVNLFASDYNNIFVHGGEAGTWTKGAAASFEDWKVAGKQDTNSFSRDPFFVAPERADWHLQSSSPSLDAAEPEGTFPPDDKEGRARPYYEAPDFSGRYDQGAFEQMLPAKPKIASLKNAHNEQDVAMVALTLAADNAADTEYAVTLDDGKRWVQEDGSVKDTVSWSKQLEWKHVGVENNKEYSYKVKARNAQKTTVSGWSEIVSLTTPLLPPKGLATSGVSDHLADISWTASAGEGLRYTVSFGTDAEGTNGGVMENLTAPSSRLSGLSSGQNYTWKVKVVNKNGESGWSDKAVFTTTGKTDTSEEKPSDGSSGQNDTSSDQSGNSGSTTEGTEEKAAESFALASVQAQSDDTSALITWTTNQAASSQVEYGVKESYGLKTDYDKEKKTEHSVSLTDLMSDILYHFRVISKNAKGEELLSADYTFITSVSPKTPIVISPQSWFTTDELRPTVTGLAESGLTVKVYFDGVYSGETSANTTGTGTGSFAYQPSSDLLPGEHTVQVLSENKAGAQSSLSDAYTFWVFSKKVSTKLTLIYDQYVENPVNSTAAERPKLVGLSAPGQTVRMYIDNQLASEFSADTNDTGNAVDFIFVPSADLEKKIHTVYYETWDGAGVMTQQSFVMTFRIVEDLPIPTVLSPVDSEMVSAQPTIIGLTNDHDTAHVFVDAVLYGSTQAQTDSDKDKNGHFEYQIPLPLKSGQHTVQVQAEDENGKRSDLSQGVEIMVQ